MLVRRIGDRKSAARRFSTGNSSTMLSLMAL
jgi:hypothetical protein